MQEPQIALKGNNLHIGSLIVTLQSRRKTRILLAAFLEQDSEIDKDQLRRRVYSARDGSSERLRSAQDICLNKLISRTRSFLRESLAETALYRQFDWLVYSESKKKYELCQIQNSDTGRNDRGEGKIKSRGGTMGILLEGKFTQGLEGFVEGPKVRISNT